MDHRAARVLKLSTGYLIFILMILSLPACGWVDVKFRPSQSLSLPKVSQPSCPIGFILVPGSPTFMTADFCVAKYEMKIAGEANGAQVFSSSFVAESRASGTPWSRIQHLAQAPTACTQMGDGYTMISNAQWQTIARNIESVGVN